MASTEPPFGKPAAREHGSRALPTPGLRGALRRRLRRLRDAHLVARTLETPWLWVTLLLLVGTWALTPGAFLFAVRVAPGTVASRDYSAARDLLLYDEEATHAKQQQARDKVLPVYDFDPGIAAERDGEIGQLFATGRHLLEIHREAGGRDEVARLLFAEESLPHGVRVPNLDQAQLLVRHTFSSDLEERCRGAIAQALRRGVVANKPLLLENRMSGVVLRNLSTRTEQVQLDLFDHLGYPEGAREMLESEVRGWDGIGAGERRALADLLLANLPVNLHLNQSETLARREAAAAATSQIYTQIRKGQILARKGDVIDAAKARVLEEMGGQPQLLLRLPPILGTLLLLGLAALVLWLSLARERVADHSRRRVFGESLLLLLLSILGAKFGILVAGSLSASFSGPPLNAWRSYAYAIPFASLALLAALLLGRNAALILSTLLGLLASRLVLDGEGMWVVLYSFAGSFAALYCIERYRFRHRLIMAWVGLAVGAINVVMVLILGALSGALGGGSAAQVVFDVVCAAAGGLLVAAVASFAVPILEPALGITTDIKLVELSNTNLPLLRRLAFEAPGTFQHSLMVANLAKEGCEAIGADPILAYTGALYHDIGKVLRPDYFIENQRPGHNRHDKLAPSMSTLILINHVKDGVELAREHHLPRVVLDAIEQHHGTRLIRFFYNRAVEQGKAHGTGEVREEKYRYPGPRPRSKMLGVLMLADGVEAASRTLVDPTPAKIRALIRTLVDDCLRDGQLDNTDLTLSDLKSVSESFLRVLATIFHQRVDYPGFDFNAGPKREKRAAVASTRGTPLVVPFRPPR